MAEKITLDKDSFKALSSDTRVSILKSLAQRRKTLTELSHEFSMSVSTVKEHLDSLSKVGLIEQKNEGHKWKYYELTAKGKDIVYPGEKSVWIMLCISILAIIVSGYGMFQQPAMMARAPAPEYSALTEAGPTAVDVSVKTAESASQAAELPYISITIMIVFAVIAGICIFLIARRRIKVF
jgi:DNA-binding transcriptional ArsR family regulator